jgi:excisionase family DNA binding protein
MLEEKWSGLGLDDYYLVSQAATVLGVSTAWIRHRAARGDLGARRMGGRWLINARDVDREFASKLALRAVSDGLEAKNG